MRTYLIDDDKNEKVIDLTRTIVHNSKLVEFHFSSVDDNKNTNSESVFIKKVANQYFASTDEKNWVKMARQQMPSVFLNVDKVFSLYRGYKPSGLSSGNQGELLTKMPGKIVKILVNEGQEVKAGETLLILEAMKMENEIKCGIDGVIKAIHVKAGDVLDEGVLMIEVEG
jgi:biotin carboxyl carrier protein